MDPIIVEAHGLCSLLNLSPFSNNYSKILFLSADIKLDVC